MTQRHWLMQESKPIDLTKLGMAWYVPVGCIDALTLTFRSPDAGASWPASLVMEVYAGISEDTFYSWPGGAITLSSASTYPYISQELRVTALAFVGFQITTICSSAYRGIFGAYGEAMY